MGILTDGKYWLLRWPGAGPVTTAPPYAFTLEHPDRWIALYEWLRDHAPPPRRTSNPPGIPSSRTSAPNSPSYRRDIAALKRLYERYAEAGTIRVKRQLWQDLLTAALGEVAGNPPRWTTSSSDTPTSPPS